MASEMADTMALIADRKNCSAIMDNDTRFGNRLDARHSHLSDKILI